MIGLSPAPVCEVVCRSTWDLLNPTTCVVLCGSGIWFNLLCWAVWECGVILNGPPSSSGVISLEDIHVYVGFNALDLGGFLDF